MKKWHLNAAACVVSLGFLVWIYTAFFMNGNKVNRLERQAFISHGNDKFEVTILNTGGTPKVYQAVTKLTSEEVQGYYFFWAIVNGKRVYIQSPIGLTLIEEK
jgi:hypothetical protein